MNDTEFRRDDRNGETSAPRLYSSNLQPIMQSLLATLADIDFEYDRKREQLSRNSPDINLKIRVLEKLKAQHHERRAPYIQQLAILQERMMDRHPA